MHTLVENKETRVIHPEKVSDVEFLMRHFWKVKTASNAHYIPIVFGAGTEESYFRNFKYDRELHRLISMFVSKKMPLSNIVTLDINRAVCSEWDRLGITTFCGDWNNLDIVSKIRDYILSIRSENYFCHKVLYANTRGDKEVTSFYPEWMRILKPHYFIGLFAARGAFRLIDVVKRVFSYALYEPMDIGIMQNVGMRGIIYYQGMFLTVLKRKKGG